MIAVLRALVQHFRTLADETPEQYVARKYPHIAPPLPWTDGTD